MYKFNAHSSNITLNISFQNKLKKHLYFIEVCYNFFLLIDVLSVRNCDMYHHQAERLKFKNWLKFSNIFFIPMV